MMQIHEEKDTHSLVIDQLHWSWEGKPKFSSAD